MVSCLIKQSTSSPWMQTFRTQQRLRIVILTFCSSNACHHTVQTLSSCCTLTRLNTIFIIFYFCVVFHIMYPTVVKYMGLITPLLYKRRVFTHISSVDEEIWLGHDVQNCRIRYPYPIKERHRLTKQATPVMIQSRMWLSGLYLTPNSFKINWEARINENE